ncbi:transposase family protein [Glutamicibacter sp.]|jgi:Integrase core domain.|uniref:integrase catalytic domain-containing protein n=1 Tax=Glutamicibacter sp. TaxID=1931995 RepID=UPI002B489010|nr:transposase family protein [Glutamicibacter sp.]HJX76662.1 transposase family protein [Glutamicibacter sp.]
MEQQPGFFEVDTVAHCGHSLKGEYLYSITLTDVFTGWTVNIAVKNRAHRNVVAGIQTLVADLPYPMTGLDFDNGGEFINVQLIEWAETNHLALTRARPYKHNDNAHVEQRNRDWVRKHAFRFRYETPEEMALLNELWTLVDQRKNHLLPMVKANGYGTARSGRRKRTYDAPRTAYQRIIDLKAMDEAHAAELAAINYSLNPAAINRRIAEIQGQLIARSKFRNNGTNTEFGEQFS